MKITKTRLKEIIREELSEAGQYGLGVPGGTTRSVADPHTAKLEALADYIRKVYAGDQKLLDLMQAAEEAVIEYEKRDTEPMQEGQYETADQRRARKKAREAKIRELMKTQGLSRPDAEKMVGRSYSQTR